MSRPTQRLPLLALPSAVVLPGAVVTVEVAREENLLALTRRAAPAADRAERCIVAPLKDPAGAIEPDGLVGVGTLVRVVAEMQLPGGTVRAVLHGLRRVRLIDVAAEDGFLTACPADLSGESEAPVAGGEDLERIVALLHALARSDPRYAGDLATLVEHNADDPARLSDLLAGDLPLDYSERSRLLAEPDPAGRIELISRFLSNALERARVGHAVEGKVRERIRQSFLREQLEVIRDELGEPDPHTREADRLADRIVATPLSDAARRAALHDLETLRRSAPSSAEAARVRNHLEWLLDLPWSDGFDEREAAEEDRFAEVARSLNTSHLGLKDVKERVIEFLAVHRLGGDADGAVVCFLGPPGTGKSSMGRAIARALRRPFAAIPVGGMTHESELVGTSSKQEGGVPGAILQEIHRLGRNDPVILLDEIDRLSLGNEGNAGGALLQILDPEHNAEFVDHFLGVPFDLSSCLFLATANETEEMPDALLDRLEIIEFAGYTESQKRAIAGKHLLPRARAAAGLADWQFKLSTAALGTVIRSYTEEAGVRHLQRVLNSLARKAAVKVVRGGRGLWLRKADLPRLLGPPTVDEDLRLLKPSVGVATGLAWTSAGGALLPIEALAMPGSGTTTLTGQVGEVMRESVQAATSYVRTRFKSLGVAQDLLDTLDIHLHFPSGGTPKDGPSAGIAVATALVSLITRVPARHDVAMTGEMSLLGNVLPVGGIREKLLAAIRAGFPEVILPQRNAEEVLRLPPEIRTRLTIHLVDDVLEVFGHALVSPATRSGAQPQRPNRRRRAARQADDGGSRRRRKPAG